jgi:peptide/nickel transport system substrate-binding protein
MADNYWQSVRIRQTSRRTMLRAGSIGLTSTGLAFVGCSSSNNHPAAKPAASSAAAAAAASAPPAQATGAAGTAATTSAAAVQATGVALDKVDLTATLKAAITTDAGNLDPQSVSGVANLPNTFFTHFDFPLVFDSQSKEVVGHMVDFRWDNNNTVLEFKVRPGITFHNGEPFDANALKFSLDRALERTDYNKGGSFKSGRKGVLSSMTGEIHVVDPMTVRCDVKADVSLPATIAPSIAMVPMGYVTKVGDDEFAHNPIGSGPFKIISRTPDTEVRSARFDQYFQRRDAKYYPRLPYIQNLVQVVRPDEQSKVAALEAGEVDILWDISPELAKQFDGKKGYRVLYVEQGNGVQVQFNTRVEKDPASGGPNPWRDMRVRKACNLAVDVPTITKKLLSGKEKPSFGASSLSFGFPQDLTTKVWGFDPKQAKQLMDAAGYANGIETDFYVGTGRQVGASEVAQAVAGYLKDIGIKTNIKTSTFVDEIPIVRQQTVPGLFLFGTNNVPEPNSNMQAEYASTGMYTLSVYPDTDIDKLFNAESAEFDTEKRRQLLNQLYTLFYENASWIFLYETVAAGVMRDKLDYTPAGLGPLLPEYWNVKVLKG